MITVLFLVFFGVVGLALALVAYSSNNRRRAGMKGTPNTPPTGTNGEPSAIRR